MNPMPPASTPLEHDLACVHCGYNLRSLDPAANCPECGQTVVSSLGRERMVHADPEWLHQLARALTFACWVFGVHVVVAIAINAAVFSELKFGKWFLPFRGVELVLAAIVSYVAYWLLTTPEPEEGAAAPPSTIPYTLRLAMSALLVANVERYITGDVGLMRMLFRGYPYYRMLLGGLDMWVALLSFRYLSLLAFRAAGQRLSTQLRILMWIELPCIATVRVLPYLLRVYQFPSPWFITHDLHWLAYFTIDGVDLYLVVLLLRLRGAVRAAGDARRNAGL